MEIQERRTAFAAGFFAALQVENGRYQQVEEYRTEPDIDDDVEHKQFLAFGVATDFERQVDEKGQCGKQDNDEVHRANPEKLRRVYGETGRRVTGIIGLVS